LSLRRRAERGQQDGSHRHAGVAQERISSHGFPLWSAVVRSQLRDESCGEADQLAGVGFHEQTQRTWLVVRRRNSANPTDMRPIARPKVLIAASACPSAGDGEEDRTL
jgi:hypothetical protein